MRKEEDREKVERKEEETIILTFFERSKSMLVVESSFFLLLFGSLRLVVFPFRLATSININILKIRYFLFYSFSIHQDPSIC